MYAARLVRSLAVALILLCPAMATAADWPMWRYDAARTAASPQELPAELHLQWVREYPPLKTAWPDQQKMQFDAVYEPVVLGKTMFVPSSRSDSVTALDTETGAEKWRFYVDGPVRFAPVAWEGKVYFTSDDGHLYCVDAERGTLVWKFRGAPAERLILGNDRLISTWPARGAPVIADGTVYFAASIWPFMGIFIHALDARTGKVIWTNDGDGSIYMKQPHNADAFAGVAPQGALAVNGERLLIPGGRSIPACYDRKTGVLLRYQLAENAKRGGGSDVSTIGELFFNGGGAFQLATEKYLGDFSKQPVLTPDVLYGFSPAAAAPSASSEVKAKGPAVRAYDLKTSGIKTVDSVDRKGQKIKVAKWTVAELSQVPFRVPRVESLIKASSRLYAASPKQITSFDFTAGATPRVEWQTSIDGTPVSLLAANDRLFAVTLEGRIYCYGKEKVEPKMYSLLAARFEGAAPDAWTSQARAILEESQARAGYCVAWGIGSGRLISELARQSNLRIIVLDADAARVASARTRWQAEGFFSDRIAVQPSLTAPLPPYFASLIVSEDPKAAGIDLDKKFVQRMFQSLRPYGGVACLSIPVAERRAFAQAVTDAGLVNAKVDSGSKFVVLSRQGALPGSANWTHEHADAANTRVSRDLLVKAPLGVLWFGGPSHEGILPRHGHGPQPQVLDGRLFIEGIDLLRAVDIYTGRLLWEANLPGVGAFYNNTAHQPGANASGTNFISTSDGIYVVHGKLCRRLDPATGKEMATFQLPPPLAPPSQGGEAKAEGEGKVEPTRWGYLNVVDEYLVGGAEPIFDPKLAVFTPKPSDNDSPPEGTVQKLVSKLSSARGDNDNLSSSRRLVVMDRHTGKVLWSVSARTGFRHNGICSGGGRLYAVDRLSGIEVARMKRRGETPTVKPRLVVFDLKTGKELWSTEDDVFGTWLSYSAKHDVLVESGRKAGDTLNDEPKGMRAYRAGTGTVVWLKEHLGPAMLHGDTILMVGKACDLLTGELKTRRDPLTGETVEWSWLRTYGCNTPAASEHLMTFRSGAAGYFDLCNDGGTGNFGGFRSSCTNNLIVAGGLLNAPEYTRTCTCSYQNQTSLALIHMPEAEMWTYFGAAEAKGAVQRVGINLGAPGDRKAADGTLWLEYPSVGGKSPSLPVVLTAQEPTWFRRHAAQVEGPLNWVAASGVKGLSALALTLSKDAVEERSYTVRLHFVEPESLQPGQRVFSMALQGREVLKDLDIVKEAGTANRSVIKEFKGIKVTKDLNVTFTAKVGVPLLCGIEVVAEGDKVK